MLYGSIRAGIFDKKKQRYFCSSRQKKFVAETEKEVYKFARSSIVADIDIPRGTLLTRENIWARRPGNGQIPGYEYQKGIGKRARKEIKKNPQLKWTDIQ